MALKGSERSRKYLGKYLRERACLCTTKDLENFLINSPKKLISCSLYCNGIPTMWTCARPVDDAFYLTSPIIPTSEWALNLVRLTHVNMAGLVIYLMIGVFNWKDDPVIPNIQLDFPEGDAVSNLGAF